jgi:hypothetical protein
MVLESILLIILIATLLAGVRMHTDLKNIKGYKEDFDKIMNTLDTQLNDLEKITDRFRRINLTEKESFQKLIDKAKTTQQELTYLSERSENILQALSSNGNSIKLDSLVKSNSNPDK